MSDYNVSDHWRNDEPLWVKSLVSSLDRRHRRTTVLPLTVAVEEILNWVKLASGPDAWVRANNRRSLRCDLEQSTAALGDSLGAEIGSPLRLFVDAFGRLRSASKDVLRTPPGMRTAQVWVDVERSAEALLTSLGTDTAVAATWDDLVKIAQNAAPADQAHHSIADLLFDQLRRRGLDPDRTFQQSVSMLAYGRSPDGDPVGENDMSPGERLAGARAIVCAPASVNSTVVWLGYQGPAVQGVTAGPVTFFNAQWAVPNSHPDGQAFPHKDELSALVQQGGLFKVARQPDDKSGVDSLVRVDLGDTTAAQAARRAVDIVETIMNVAIYRGGGSRPRLAQSAVLHDGQPHAFSFVASRHPTEFPDDRYGARMTAEAIRQFGPRIASAVARDELPPFLAAALEAQTTAEHPFSRDMMLRQPSEADIRAVIPLTDRVVQHIAAHAAMKPEDLFATLGMWWPHQRWLTDVSRAVHMCIAPLGGDPEQRRLRDELSALLYSAEAHWPFLLAVAERREDLLAVCRVESDRDWIERIFISVSDHAEYSALVESHQRERDVLAARRTRTRDALVHGNPAGFRVIESVRDFAEYLSGWALNLGLESYTNGTLFVSVLQTGTDEFEAMSAGADAASYWQSWLDAQGESPAGQQHRATEREPG
ncbi:hypothetical protein [Nocardioides ultimimeridianus]